MYNLIDYSSNYSYIKSSLWFYSEDGATNFDANVENNGNFTSFKDKEHSSSACSKSSQWNSKKRNNRSDIKAFLVIFGDHLKCRCLMGRYN